MKKQLLILFIFSATVCLSQPIRFHLGGGFANYAGDLQQKRFTLQQADGVVSAGGTLNVTDKLALRGDYSYGHVGANDNRSKKPEIVARNLNFQSKIYDLALMVEYDLFNLTERRMSPYVFSGVGVYHFNSYTYDSLARKAWLVSYSTEGEGLPEYPDRKIYKRTQLNVPFGAGVKYALSPDVYIGFEIGIRKLFTDYLDDVSSTYVDPDILRRRKGSEAVSLAFRGDEVKGSSKPYPVPGTRRGSPAKDYYYFGQLRISFRMPWFERFGNNEASGKTLKCPTKI